jgi:hypothetical protein
MIPTIHQISYQNLWEALRQMGFEERGDERGRTFKHGSGAFLSFPNLSEGQPVRAYHFAAARAQVEGFDILNGKDFDLLLARLVSTKVAA